MLSTSAFRKDQRLPGVIAIVAAILAASWHGIATGDEREEFLKARAVKVIVRGGDPDTVASGFLWKRPDWVVTNLHAIPEILRARLRSRCRATMRREWPRRLLLIARDADC